MIDAQIENEVEHSRSKAKCRNVEKLWANIVMQENSAFPPSLLSTHLVKVKQDKRMTLSLVLKDTELISSLHAAKLL